MEEYDFDNNYDWNTKSDEFKTPEEFWLWREENKSEQFLKNIDRLIKLTTQDMILIKKQKMSEIKLKSFEDLIKGSISHEVFSTALSKYEEGVLLDPHASMEDIDRGFREAKQIMDKDGNIDSSKVEKSLIFTGGDINLPNFENYIKKNPEYTKTFNVWKKLFDNVTHLMVAELHAFRNSTTLEMIRELRTYLINYKKEHNL